MDRNPRRRVFEEAEAEEKVKVHVHLMLRVHNLTCLNKTIKFEWHDNLHNEPIRPSKDLESRSGELMRDLANVLSHES